jgi:hypothetical protein
LEPAGLLGSLARRAHPVSTSRTQLLPVPAAFAPLLPEGALRRGSTVVVADAASGGARSVALALTAGASAAGSWCAAVGCGDLGAAAAAELGMDLERLALVPTPAGRWADILATLLEGFDLVLFEVAFPLRAMAVRRLTARLRRHRSVLVVFGSHPWPEAPEVHLNVRRASWEGLGRGEGHLRARRVLVEVTGRGPAARIPPRTLWLPHPDGTPYAEVRDDA